MSDKYEDLLKEAEESGEIPSTWLDRIRNTYEASGLRTDLKDTREKYRAALEENETLRTGVLTTTFKSLGISANPKAFALPSDLNPTDEEAVSNWAQDMGLIPKVETTTGDERAVHDRISSASNEGTLTSIPTEADIQNASTPEELYRLSELRAKALQR